MCNVSDMENLASYLSARGISRREFARSLGVDPSTTSRLARGEMVPSLELAVKIEKLTRGRVKAAYWVSDEFKAAVAGSQNQVAQMGNGVRQ